MYRILLLLVIPVAIASSGKAQSLKVHGGINITTISDVYDGSAAGQAGFQVGVSAMFGDHFYIEPGFFYIRRFTEISLAGGDSDLRVNGFHVPFSAGYYLIGKNDGPVTLRIFGGPSVFIVNASEGPIPDNEINKAQWNVFAGAGADFLFFFLETRYEWSLTSLADSRPFTGRYTSFFLGGGVRFPL